MIVRTIKIVNVVNNAAMHTVILDGGIGMRQIWGRVVRYGPQQWVWMPPHDACLDEYYGPYPTLKSAIKSCIWAKIGYIGYPIFKMNWRELFSAPEA